MEMDIGDCEWHAIAICNLQSLLRSPVLPGYPRRVRSIPRQRPRRAGRVGHGGTKLPALGVQLAEDPLDQRRFAAEQMDDIRNIQQHALGKNVRIDSHQGRELLASRRHGLESDRSEGGL